MSLDATTRAAIIGGSANVLAIAAGLLGVYGNLAWNRKQHKDEKSYNLRRDVYLEATDVISRAVTFLAGKAVSPSDEEKETAKKKENEISTDLSGVCAKLHILGTKRVVAATIAFQSVFDEWSDKIGAHRRAAAEGKKRRDDVHKQIEQFRARILAALAPKDDSTRKPTDSVQTTGNQEELPKPVEDAATVAKEVQAQLQQKLDSLTKEFMGASAEIFQKNRSWCRLPAGRPQSVKPTFD